MEKRGLLLSALFLIATLGFSQSSKPSFSRDAAKTSIVQSIGKVPRPSHVEKADTVIREVTGDIRPYLSSFYWQIGPYSGFDESFYGKICFAEDGKTIYICDLVPYVTEHTWVKGELQEDGTVTVPSEQCVSTTFVGGKWYIGGFVKNEETGEFTPIEEYQFKLSDDRNTLELKDYSGQKVYTIGYTDQGDILSVQRDNKFTYFDKELVVLPKGIKAKAYNITYYNTEDSKVPIKGMVKVAFSDKGDVYMQGLCPFVPKNWVKGTVEGETVKIPTGQYVGLSGNYVQFLYAYETNDNGEEVATDFIKFDMKDGKKTLRTNRDALAKIGYINLMQNITMALENISYVDAGLKPAKPAKPLIRSFDEKRGELHYSIMTKDTEGNDMDLDSLSWRLYIDDELYTFKKDKYQGLEEDMTEVPYGYSNLLSFWFDGKSDVVSPLADMPKTSIAIESVYRLDGVENVSERATLSVTSGIDFASSDKSEVKSIVYTDLSGNLVSRPAKGIYIKITTFADGKKEIRKVVK